jgi:hypothetical protein
MQTDSILQIQLTHKVCIKPTVLWPLNVRQFPRIRRSLMPTHSVKLLQNIA